MADKIIGVVGVADPVAGHRFRTDDWHRIGLPVGRDVNSNIFVAFWKRRWLGRAWPWRGGGGVVHRQILIRVHS